MRQHAVVKNTRGGGGGGGGGGGINEHQKERALQGETSDGISFVYYPETNLGVWNQYQNGLRGVGLLSERNLGMLSEIVQNPKSN